MVSQCDRSVRTLAGEEIYELLMNSELGESNKEEPASTYEISTDPTREKKLGNV